MNLKIERFQKVAASILLLVLIPLWNIPHTIAGRYICEAILLILILASKQQLRALFQANRALMFFIAYLFIQLIFFSIDYRIAFSGFRSEWMHFIIFSVIGGGAGLMFGKKSSPKILLYLGLVFSLPLYIHLALALKKGFEIGAIPWNYWGINQIHGDFGYPALEATILLTTFLFYTSKKTLQYKLSIIMIIASIASPLLATSRGGTGFAILGAILVIASYFFTSSQKTIGSSKKILCAITSLICLLGIYKIALESDPARWSGIISRLSIGLEGNPSDVYCKGIETLKNELKNKGVLITPELQKRIDSIVAGDGARIMVARSGLQLLLENPMGINQSKEAYQQAIIAHCKGNPKHPISHAHNAWIDTALAIGIPGAILLLLTLLSYAKLGYTALKENSEISPFGMALFVSAFMWILRGFLDSTMRDQMLEMQAFIFSLLLGLILAKTNKIKNRLIE